MAAMGGFVCCWWLYTEACTSEEAELRLTGVAEGKENYFFIKWIVKIAFIIGMHVTKKRSSYIYTI